MLVCPFCHITARARKHFRLTGYLDVAPVDGYFKAKLTHSKEIAICQEHYHVLRKRGIHVTANGREPYKITEIDRQLINTLKSFQKPPIINSMTTKEQGSLDYFIRQVVGQFETDSRSFSALDVTNEIRRKVNQGESEVLGRPFETVGGISTQRVNHTEVRDELHSLYDSGAFPNLTRSQGTGYLVYSVAASLPPAAPAVAATPSAPTLASPPAVSVLDPHFQKSPPVHRVKRVVDGKFLTLPSGRTVWKRRCDFTNGLNCTKPEYKAAVKRGLEDGSLVWETL